MNKREIKANIWAKLVTLTAKPHWNWTTADAARRSAWLDLYVELFTPRGNAEDRARVIHDLRVAAGVRGA